MLFRLRFRDEVIPPTFKVRYCHWIVQPVDFEPSVDLLNQFLVLGRSFGLAFVAGFGTIAVLSLV